MAGGGGENDLTGVHLTISLGSSFAKKKQVLPKITEIGEKLEGTLRFTTIFQGLGTRQ